MFGNANAAPVNATTVSGIQTTKPTVLCSVMLNVSLPRPRTYHQRRRPPANTRPVPHVETRDDHDEEADREPTHHVLAVGNHIAHDPVDTCWLASVGVLADTVHRPGSNTPNRPVGACQRYM